MNTRLWIASGAITLSLTVASAALAGPPVPYWPPARAPHAARPPANPAEKSSATSCDCPMMQTAAMPCMSPPAKPDAAG
jgi:hypothetical protein